MFDYSKLIPSIMKSEQRAWNYKIFKFFDLNLASVNNA